MKNKLLKVLFAGLFVTGTSLNAIENKHKEKPLFSNKEKANIALGSVGLVGVGGLVGGLIGLAIAGTLHSGNTKHQIARSRRDAVFTCAFVAVILSGGIVPGKIKRIYSSRKAARSTVSEETPKGTIKVNALNAGSHYKDNI